MKIQKLRLFTNFKVTQIKSQTKKKSIITEHHIRDKFSSYINTAAGKFVLTIFDLY